MRALSSRVEETSNLSPSLTRRLNFYALAAGAAGAGLLTSGRPAEARVVYTPAHVVIHTGSTYNLDVNHDGVTDFQFSNFLVYYGQLIVLPQGGGRNALEVLPGFNYFPLALNQGARIGPGAYFWGSCVGCLTYDGTMVDAFSAGVDEGDWINVRNHFLGLRIIIDDKAHYGWARLSVQVDGTSITAVLTGYAYETQPGTTILAGQTSGAADDAGESEGLHPTAPDPDSKPISLGSGPASLGVLALGAQGLALWRSDPADPASR
jgi:hypothetical protein